MSKTGYIQTGCLALLCSCQASGGEGSAPLQDTAETSLSDTAAQDDTGEAPEVDCAAAQATAVSARIHDTYGTLVVVSWTQEAAATTWVEYSFDDGVWLTTPSADASAGLQEQLLLGIPYGTEVTYRVAYRCEEEGPFTTADLTISTDPAPAGLPSISVLASDPSRWDSDMDYVFTSMDGSWSVIVDRSGRVVWSRRSSEYTLYPRLSVDGRSLLIDEGTFWSRFDDGAASQIIQTNIDGSSEQAHDSPGLFIGFTDLPDGSIAWPATGDSTAPINDDTLQLLTPDGEQVQVWSCKEFWESAAIAAPPPGDYCAANTLSWSEARGTFLWTSFAPELIIEIDRSTGQTVHYFGHVDGSWGFSPSSGEFWLPHGSTYTDAGTLLMSSDLTEAGEETIVIEYTLDEATETLVELWSFGEGEGLYGAERGEAHRLQGGNTLHNIGGQVSRLREITPDGAVVWDLDFNAAGGIGGSSPITDIYALAP